LDDTQGKQELIRFLPVQKPEYMPYLMEQMIQFYTLKTAYAKIIIVQGGREVTVHRPIRYHNLI